MSVAVNEWDIPGDATAQKRRVFGFRSKNVDIIRSGARTFSSDCACLPTYLPHYDNIPVETV